jgi:hypothetical protein
MRNSAAAAAGMASPLNLLSKGDGLLAYWLMQHTWETPMQDPAAAAVAGMASRLDLPAKEMDFGLAG